MCIYLNFLWVAIFDFPQDQYLHTAIDCGLNVPVRLIQSVATSVTNLHSLDLNGTTVELECFTNAAGLTVRDSVVVALQTFLDFILVVAVASVTDVGFSADLQALGIPAAKLAAMQFATLQGANTDLDLVDIVQTVRDPNTLITIQGLPANTTIPGLSNLITIAEAPWTLIFTETLNFGLSLANQTWDLTLLTTEYTGTPADIKWFQTGALARSFVFLLT